MRTNALCLPHKTAQDYVSRRD